VAALEYREPCIGLKFVTTIEICQGGAARKVAEIHRSFLLKLCHEVWDNAGGCAAVGSGQWTEKRKAERGRLALNPDP